MVVNPLQSLHEQAEASFLPYANGVQIVEDYGEPEAEYAALRKGAALMDSPHRAVAILTGKDRLSFLHNKVTNDTNRLTPGTGCYAYLLNLKGRIVADLNILQGEDATLVEMDGRLIGDFVAGMEKYIFTEDVRVLHAGEQLGRLSVLGPRAAELLKKVMDAGVETLGEPFRHARRMVGKVMVTVYRNDLAGVPQYELIVPRDQLVTLWQVLHEAGHGEENGGGGLVLRGIGWSAFNTARIEAGTPLYGIDITEHYLPMETGHWYPRAVCVTKGCYLGQEIVARMHAHNTVARLLVGLRVEGGGPVTGIGSGGVPVAGTEVFDVTGMGQQIGMVTSSCLSPLLGNVPIALGYVKRAFSGVGKEVAVLADGGRRAARVAALPFVGGAA